jgi:hypothetical protein
MGHLQKTYILTDIIINMSVTVKMSHRKQIYVHMFTYEAGKIPEQFFPSSSGVLSKVKNNA